VNDGFAASTGDGHPGDGLFLRLLRGEGGPPLRAEEFDRLQRHLDGCRPCRARFARERDRARQGDEALTGAQLDTILNVVLERAGEDPVVVPAAAPRSLPAERAAAPASRPLWRRPLPLGLGLAAFAMCAALMLLPLEPRRPEFRARGDRARPSRSAVCLDPRAATEEPLAEPVGHCPVGRRLAVHASEIEGLPYVTVVTCTAGGQWRCSLDAPSATRAPGETEVDVLGPALRPQERWRIFTVWSADPLTSAQVGAAVEVLRARGARPDDTNELPFDKETKQLAHTVVAGEGPS
jgi:hypothetical protein